MNYKAFILSIVIGSYSLETVAMKKEANAKEVAPSFVPRSITQDMVFTNAKVIDDEYEVQPLTKERLEMLQNIVILTEMRDEARKKLNLYPSNEEDPKKTN